MLSLLEENKAEWEALLLQFRTHFHQNPELSFEEVKTSAYIRSVLSEAQISYDYPWVNTGIVALFGPKETSILGFRGDMDALPIQEENKGEHISQIEGKMHACGHDVHSAIMLALCLFLKKYESQLKHQVLVVFQPGEELLPGGASLMIKEGLLKKYPLEHMLALHVFPEMESGYLGVKEGMYMASCDEIHIKVKGKGGHGAMPHLNCDPVVSSSELIIAMQKVVSRFSNPIIPSVLSFGKINSSGGATNVIPNEVVLEGTFRTLNEEWRAEAHQQIKRVAEGIALMNNVFIEVDIRKGYPFVYNDEVLTQKVKKNLQDAFGPGFIKDLPIRMTGEDFSYFSQNMATCFFRLGVRNEEKGIIHGVHHPQFDVDEKALLVGLKAMVANLNKL